MLAVAAQNPNTIVVVHSVGPLILEPWIDHPNVTAVRTLSIKRRLSSELTVVVSLGPLGRFTGPRNRECPRRRFVWRLEPVWKASVHDRETGGGLSCSGRNGRVGDRAD